MPAAVGERPATGQASQIRQGRSAKTSPTVALSGIASTAASDLLGDLDDDTLRKRLTETGRRILGLRPPRTPRTTG